jgi:hypothetical protein
MKSVNEREGLTLMELLLGLLIFSLIALSLYSTYVNGVRVSHRVKLRDNLFREARWVVDTLTFDLENMVVYRGLPAPGKAAEGSLTGSQDRLKLILPTKDGLSEIEYYLQYPEYGSVFQTIIQKRSSSDKVVVDRRRESVKLAYLIREEQPLQIPEPNGVDADDQQEGKEILSRMVQQDSLRLAYADSGVMGDTGISWRTDWNEAYLPAGVRIELVLQPDSEDDLPQRIHKEILVPLGAWGKKEK